MKSKILIALPAFNEEKVIASVIKQIKNEGYANIVVINDGSKDQTKKEAEKAGVFVVSHYKNSGLGVSLKTAMLLAKKNNFDILVTMDSDGQHKARDIKHFVEKIEKGNDVVVGVRNLKEGQVKKTRRLILFLSDVYTFLLFGVLTHDSQSGFRAFSKKAISSINLRSERMEVSSEVFSEIKRNKLRYSETPIKAVYTKYSLAKGQKNSNMFRVGWKLFMQIFK